MSLKTQAKTLQSIGYRNSGQDSMLAHITPKEAGLLKMFGGSGRIDPQTGLPHFDEGASGGDGNGGNSGSSGWGGEPGGDRGDGGIGASGPGNSSGDGGNMGPPGDLSNDFMGPPEGLAGDSWSGGLEGTYGDQFGDYDMPTTPQTPGWASQSVDPGSDYSNEGVNYSGPTGLNPSTEGIFGNISSEPDYLARVLKYITSVGKSKALAAVSQAVPGIGMALPAAMAAVNATPDTPVGQQVAGAVVDTIAAPVLGPIQAVKALANVFGANLNMQTPGSGLAHANLDYKGLGPGESGYGTSTTGQTGTGGSMFDQAMGLAGGLGGLYSMYRQNSDNSTYMNGLSGMYGQGSPYATALRQQLSRRDAASGRRSQYGPREVELQAKLAQMQAGLAPSMMQGRQNNFGNSMQMFQQLGAMNKAGLFDGLKGLFSGGSGGFEMPQTAWGDSSLTPTDNSFSDGWDW
jgi:hypothetical protein